MSEVFSDNERWDVGKARTRFEGLVQCPIAASGPAPPVFLRVCAPMETIIIRWVVESMGPPEVPSWDLQDARFVFLSGEVGAATPVTDGFNNFKYKMQGVYKYGVRFTEHLDAEIQMGRRPWDDAQTSFINTFSSSNFRTDLVGGVVYIRSAK